MQLRNLAPATQRGYLHYVADYAKYYDTSPEHLDLEAVRQYELHLLHEKKLSPESINTFVSAVKFLYLNTLEMPWGQEQFPRVRRPSKLPVVLSPDEVSQFFEHTARAQTHSESQISRRTHELLWCGPAHLRSGVTEDF